MTLRGGAKRDRTVDLLHAMQALSQLSYNPTSKSESNYSVKNKQNKCFFPYFYLFFLTY